MMRISSIGGGASVLVATTATLLVGFQECGGHPQSATAPTAALAVGSSSGSAVAALVAALLSQVGLGCECDAPPGTDPEDLSGCNPMGPTFQGPDGRPISIHASPDGSNDQDGDGFNDDVIETREDTEIPGLWVATISLPVGSTVWLACTECVVVHVGGGQ